MSIELWNRVQAMGGSHTSAKDPSNTDSNILFFERGSLHLLIANDQFHFKNVPWRFQQSKDGFPLWRHITQNRFKELLDEYEGITDANKVATQVSGILTDI